MKDTVKGETDGKREGNSTGLLLLIVPIASLIWAANTVVVFPFDQFAFFRDGFLILLLTFAGVFYLSFRGVKYDGTMIAVASFLFALWFIGGVLGLAKINTALDETSPVTQYSKIIKAQKMSGNAKGGASCLVWIEPLIQEISSISLKYNECDVISSGVDGVEIHLKAGALGFSWMADHSVVKDIDTYKARLNIK